MNSSSASPSGGSAKMIELKKEIEYLKKYGPAVSSAPVEGFET